MLIKLNLQRFALLGTLIFFDENITKVTAYTQSGTLVGEVTTSSDVISEGTGDYNYVVELKKGYTIASVNVNFERHVNNLTNNTFQFDDNSAYTEIHITSAKVSTNNVKIYEPTLLFEENSNFIRGGENSSSDISQMASYYLNESTSLQDFFDKIGFTYTSDYDDYLVRIIGNINTTDGTLIVTTDNTIQILKLMYYANGIWLGLEGSYIDNNTRKYTFNTQISGTNDIIILASKLAPTYSFKHWKKSNVKINQTGNYYFRPYTILGLYTITTTLTSCQASPTNVDRIEENSSVTLYFSKITSSYVLPDSVEVTNATYTWDKDTGALALSNPTGDISITITAVEALPQLATPTNVAVTDTTLTFDEVENATSYEVFVDNVSIGTYIGSKTLTLPTSTELGVSVDGYSVAQGDISVSEGVYNAITALNNGGSLTDFGNTCGLTIPSTQVKYFNMGLRLIAGDDVEIVDGKYRATIIVPTLTSQNDDNVYLIEFDYTNNTATYTAISVEDVDVVNHLIVCDFEKADGSTLLLLCYGGG